MAGLFQRLGAVARAEWSSRWSRPEQAGDRGDHRRRAASRPSSPPVGSRLGRPDVDSAWRMLELEPGADLVEVRAAYQRLARRYHPRAVEPGNHAARTVVESLTDALEVLEAHLLPVSSSGRGVEGAERPGYASS